MTSQLNQHWHLKSALDRLRGANASRWPNITAAGLLSCDKLALIAEIARDLLPRDEGSLVVFGSLARGEFTPGSDVDWTIMIDGRADSRHLEIVHSLKPKLDTGFKAPGPTEVFGGLVFSHDLIYAIGGDEDTNRNMTCRPLLLRELVSIGASESEQVHNRIVNGIYIDTSKKTRVSFHGMKRRIEFLGSSSMTSCAFGEQWLWITRVNIDLVREINGRYAI